MCNTCAHWGLGNRNGSTGTRNDRVAKANTTGERQCRSVTRGLVKMTKFLPQDSLVQLTSQRDSVIHQNEMLRKGRANFKKKFYNDP